MKEFQAFAISNFRVGFDEAVEPWLLPRDAYQTVINAHLYRGVLEKIQGYSFFASMSYRNELVLSPTPDGTNKTFIGMLTSTPTTNNFYGWGAIVLGTSAETFSYASDFSSTVITLVGTAGGTGTVNISTLAVSLTFNTAPPSSTYSSVIFSWDSAPGSTEAIMGIKQYYRSDSTQSVMIFNQKRVGLIVNMKGVLASTAGTVYGISEIPHDYYQSAVVTTTTGLGPYTGTLTVNPFIPGTVRFLHFTSAGKSVEPAITDDGVGGIKGQNINHAASFINYA